MKPDWITDDDRRYEVLEDRVNVHREKAAWFLQPHPATAKREVIESDFIGHHLRVPPEQEEHYFVRINPATDDMERIPTGPFIPRF